MKVRIVAGTAAKDLVFAERDFKVLLGPREFMSGGAELVAALGVFENFSVALNRPRSPVVLRDRRALAAAFHMASRTAERDADLLGYDYSFSFTEQSFRGSGAVQGFRVGDLFGSVNARPRGFCSVEFQALSPDGTGRTACLLDLRVYGELETADWGTLRLHRRKAAFALPQVLEDAWQFLEHASSSQVEVHNR